MSEPITCLSNQAKSDLEIWFDKRIKEWGELKKLHRSLLNMNREEYEGWQLLMDDMAFYYEDLKREFVEEVPNCEGK